MTHHKPILMFTYGTMRKECYNNGRINGSKYLGQAETCEPFVMVAKKEPRQIPYVGRVPSDDKLYPLETKIQGEVYLLDYKTLKRVDTAEGHPHFYFRETCYVRMDDGTIMECFIYLFDVSDSYHTPVPTGDFLDYYNEKEHKHQGHTSRAFYDPTKNPQLTFHPKWDSPYTTT